MQRLLVFVLTACCFLMIGCPPHVQQLAVEGVEQAMNANDKMVDSLSILQDRVRAQRKAAMMLVAKTAPSHEEGRARLDAIEQAYAPVFETFERAAEIQAALANALDAALIAAHNGEQQDMSKLLRLYAQLQRLYNELARTIGEIGGSP